MDILEIINSTRAYNFHSHTQFCDGRADMVRFVCAAVEAGIKHLGFTPHSPIPIESSCNMKLERVNEYIEEFNQLKARYSDKIKLHMSMEIDYLGENWGASHEYFRKLPLDYRLSSIHFIPTQEGDRMIDVDGSPAGFIEKMGKYFHNDIRYVVDKFYAQTLAMIEKGGFDIIGHFDKIGFNASNYRSGIEDEVWYRKHIDDVIDAIKGAGIVAEINTKAWEAPAGSSEETKRKHTPRLFPSAGVIRRMRDAGIPLVVNSDVHYPERISVGRDAAFEILDS